MTEAPSIKEALEAARQFIENGVELGYIKMPDADTPDPAHKTLGKIIAALATLSPPAGERREAIARIVRKACGNTFLNGYGDENIQRATDAILASGLVQDEAGWRDISTAKKDRTPIIAKFFDDIYPRIEPNRPDLESWNGLHVVIRHPGLTDSGFDIGWNVAAPVGNGGLPDRWIEGWKPLPTPPIRSARDGGAES